MKPYELELGASGCGCGGCEGFSSFAGTGAPWVGADGPEDRRRPLLQHGARSFEILPDMATMPSLPIIVGKPTLTNSIAKRQAAMSDFWRWSDPLLARDGQQKVPFRSDPGDKPSAPSEQKELAPSAPSLVRRVLEGYEILPENSAELFSYEHENVPRPTPETHYLARPFRLWEQGIQAWSYFDFQWNRTPFIAPYPDPGQKYDPSEPGAPPPTCAGINYLCRLLRDDARLACAEYNRRLQPLLEALRLYMPCSTQTPGPVTACDGLREALRENSRAQERNVLAQTNGGDLHFYNRESIRLGMEQMAIQDALNACADQERRQRELTGAVRRAECNAREENTRRFIREMELFHAAVTVPLQDCGRSSAPCIEPRYYPNPDPRPGSLYYLPQSECPP